MAHQTIEEMEVFRWYVEVANQVWKSVEAWKPFERDTVGKQLVRAVDSIGANLVEGMDVIATAMPFTFSLLLALPPVRRAIGYNEPENGTCSLLTMPTRCWIILPMRLVS